MLVEGPYGMGSMETRRIDRAPQLVAGSLSRSVQALGNRARSGSLALFDNLRSGARRLKRHLRFRLKSWNQSRAMLPACLGDGAQEFERLAPIASSGAGSLA